MMLKKFGLLLVSLILLTACNRDSMDETNGIKDQPVAVSLEGQISPIEISLYQKGTHKLTTADGQEVIIASPTINLGNFLEGSVKIAGHFEGMVGSEQKVVIVESIDRSEGSAVEEQSFQSRAFGVQFSYPTSLELKENGNEVSFLRDGQAVITLNLIKTELALADFLKERETTEGAAVTLGGQSAQRFFEGEKARVYLEDRQRGQVLLFTFPDTFAESRDADRTVFYDLLSSLHFLYFKKPTGEPCGGAKNITCQQGFRCELESASPLATGICVDPASDTSEILCPFIAVPRGCQNYQVESSTQEGCPVSYKCLDKTENKTEGEGLSRAETRDPDPRPTGETTIPETTEKKTENPMGDPIGGPIGDPIGNENQNTETETGTETTKQESPAKTEEVKNDPEPTKKSDDLANGSPTGSPIGSPTGSPTGSPIGSPIGQLTRSYQNPYYHFTAYYHRNWYFKSFGPDDPTLWAVGFSDQTPETREDVQIMLKLMPGEEQTRHSKSSEGVYTFLIPRNAESHFVLEGPASFQPLIEEMAQALVFE